MPEAICPHCFDLVAADALRSHVVACVTGRNPAMRKQQAARRNRLRYRKKSR